MCDSDSDDNYYCPESEVHKKRISLVIVFEVSKLKDPASTAAENATGRTSTVTEQTVHSVCLQHSICVIPVHSSGYLFISEQASHQTRRIHHSLCVGKEREKSSKRSCLFQRALQASGEWTRQQLPGTIRPKVSTSTGERQSKVRRIDEC